ncbi:MAG: DUF3175 domain-containing protein [Opitutaceae bacterium]
MKPRRRTRKTVRRWSGRVTATSHAMDLEPGVFKGSDPKRIAASVKRSAERSRHLKTTPYRSALSMITFYSNRGGRNLTAQKKAVLQRAKGELKRLFGKDER